MLVFNLSGNQGDENETRKRRWWVWDHHDRGIVPAWPQFWIEREKLLTVPNLGNLPLEWNYWNSRRGSMLSLTSFTQEHLIINDYHWLSLIIIDYHWLSLIITDYHWLSLVIIDYQPRPPSRQQPLIIIDYHWLSLIIIDYHWLSLIIIDYNWLSLVFIYYHWLSFFSEMV